MKTISNAEIALLPYETVLHKQKGWLYITHPKDVNVMLTFVFGDFYITNQRLLFVQEPYDGYSGGYYPEGGVNLEMKREDIVRIHKKRLSSRLFLFTKTGAVSVSVSKWKNFCTLLGHQPR